jgi:hypothetical protein
VYKGINIVIYDSWGMEAAKADRWKTIIEVEVKKNGAQEVYDWFHTVIYCVDAERARVEDFEIHDVLRPLISGGNRILFALTKVGLNEANTRATAAVLAQEFPDCEQVEVESIAAQPMLASKPPTEKKGREELLEKICHNLWDNILSKSIAKYQDDSREALYKKLTTDTLEYFDRQAGQLGIVTHYGDDFKKDIMFFAESKARSILGRTEAKLQDNLQIGLRIASATATAFSGKPLVIGSLDINNQVVAACFEAWDNSVAAHVASALTCLIFPPAIQLRKSMMMDYIRKACIKFTDALEDGVSEHAQHLYRQWGRRNVKKREIGLSEIVRNGSAYDIYKKIQ